MESRQRICSAHLTSTTVHGLPQHVQRVASLRKKEPWKCSRSSLFSTILVGQIITSSLRAQKFWEHVR